MTQRPLLWVDGLTIGRPAAPPLVSGVTFSLDGGRTLGIVGESGSGKTLTASALCALLPYPVTVVGGEAGFNGHRLHLSQGRTPGFIRGRDLLFLFQSPSCALDPTRTIGAHITGALGTFSRFRPKERLKKARQLMERVGLSRSCEKRYPFQLSGGQQQRVLLAVAFGLRPRILIADEPTAGQDVTNQQRIIGLLKRFQQDTGSACIVISHDLRILSLLADRLLVLFRGRQVETGPTEQVIHSPAHPHTRDLVGAFHFLRNEP